MKEQERKFILKYLPSELEPITIKQGYLMLLGDKQLRVRVLDNTAFICYKKHHSSTIRDEFEYEIPFSDGIELLKTCEYQLSKNRYKTTFESNHVDIDIDIDIYDDGLQVVEIEYDDELTTLPDYCGDEITGNKEYSNINIAINNSNKTIIAVLCRDSDDFLNWKNEKFNDFKNISRRSFSFDNTVYVCVSEPLDIIKKN